MLTHSLFRSLTYRVYALLLSLQPIHFYYYHTILYHSIVVPLGYFQYAGGFEPRKAFDITATLPNDGRVNPMFVIEAVKAKNTASRAA